MSETARRRRLVTTRPRRSLVRVLAAAWLLAAATAALPAPAVAVPAAPTAGAPEVFALVVTSNRSSRLERPDLQYADDDGARYYQMFEGLARPGRVQLLTRFDRASQAVLPPALVASARPPRLAGVKAALADLAVRVAEARQRGRRTQFYFVYAGHGDVEGGAGYLDLEDGRIDSAFLEEEVVNRVGADVEHIVLDSCNSFFVVNPRKPGGRRWATPKDMALGFAKRHPGVGLFLSTNSEAEVYEWSELESGIFSHEVRSGLSGAADVNRDGQVSYAELAAFVDRANAGLPRANLRPQIFFRGPADDGAASLFDLTHAQGRRISLSDDERRLWIRGASGERLIDLHKERGPLTVLVPGRPEQALSIVESLRPGDGKDARPALREYQIGAGTAPVELAQLTPERGPVATRGGAAMFGQLFSLPFGPQAFTAFLAVKADAEEPVFGISTADEARMRHYLSSIASSDEATTRMQAFLLGGVGALVLGGTAAQYFAEPRASRSPSDAVVSGAFGLALLGSGLHIGLAKPLGVKALEAFEDELRRKPENRGIAVVNTESYLGDLARQEDRNRRYTGFWMFGISTLVAIAVTTNVVDGEPGARDPSALVFGYGTPLFLGAIGALIMTTEMPTQRLLRLYHTDPDLKTRMDVAILPGGVAGLSLRGKF